MEVKELYKIELILTEKEVEKCFGLNSPKFKLKTLASFHDENINFLETDRTVFILENKDSDEVKRDVKIIKNILLK